MKASKIVLAAIFSATVLCGCGNNKNAEVKYTLGFYQAEGDKLDQMEVVVGKTTYQDVLNFESNIQINERVGYDVEWEQFDFEKLDHDYVVDADYVLHNYVISFMFGNEVVATTTYNVESANTSALFS